MYVHTFFLTFIYLKTKYLDFSDVNKITLNKKLLASVKIL